MKLSQRIFSFAFASVFSAILTPDVQAAEFTITRLPSFDKNSGAVDISNSGVVVGWSKMPSLTAVRWTASGMTVLGNGQSSATGVNAAGETALWQIPQYRPSEEPVVVDLLDRTRALDKPGGAGLPARTRGINDHGDVVGTYFSFGSAGYTAVLWKGSQAFTLGRGEAYALNNAGMVVGASLAAGYSAPVPLMWTPDGVQHVLGTLGGGEGIARAVNNSGQIVGQSTNSAGRTHATLWDKGQTVDLGQSFLASVANDINAYGQVVGSAEVVSGGAGVSHAMLWSDGIGIDLDNYLDESLRRDGWVFSVAQAINDQGWIVGNMTKANNPSISAAIVLTPVPEPAAWLLLPVGLIALCAVQRRRARTPPQL